MADILVLNEGGRVKYAATGEGVINLLRDIAVVEYSDGSTEVVGDMNRNNATLVQDVTLPEGFVANRFDYVDGQFVAVPEEDEVGQ